MAAGKNRSDPRDEVIRTVAALLRADPGLVAGAVDAAAPRAADRRNVRDHLSQRPAALTSGASDGPPVISRLIGQLRERGLKDVRLPECVECGRGVTLRCRVPGGRLCMRCAAHARATECSVCGKTKPINARSQEGEPLCSGCSRERIACTVCGREAVVATRTGAGEPLCPSCAPKRTRQCSSCGEMAPAHANTSDGPVCVRCYRHPERKCGVCGQVRRIGVRAKRGQPDICDRCYRRPIPPCPVCGERTDCGHDLPDDLQPAAAPLDEDRNRLLHRLRQSPRPARPCLVCKRVMPVQARWPAGDVCNACYTRILGEPGPCSNCGRDAVLIGRVDGLPVCGPCAGSELDYRCAMCEEPGRMYQRGRCVDCVLEVRLHDVLGPASEHLEPLRAALMLEPDARTVLAWIRRPGVDAALRELAAVHAPITHATVDAMTSGKSAEYLRALLVDIGALSVRNEPLERTAAWLSDFFDGVDREHVRLLRPFAEWTLMRRARRRDREGKFTVGSARFLRQRVHAALHFLAWLDQHGWSLATLRQKDIDLYLAAGPTTRYQVRDFIHWAVRHREAPQVVVPLRQQLRPSNAYDEPGRLERIASLLRDDSIPIEIRVAGALVLVYGQHLSRIVTWTVDRVGHDERSGAVTLRFDRVPVTLAEPVGGLVLELVDRRRGQARAGRSGDWLFPGGLPGRHIDPGHMGTRLAANGIDLRDGRNAAVAELATDIPAPVLAELLGMHDNTAVSWTKSMQRDWTSFIATTSDRK